MNTDHFHRLHHRGWDLTRRVASEREWLDLMSDMPVPDKREALTDFMAQRNANVMHHRTRKGRVSAPILRREIINGFPCWVPDTKGNQHGTG